MRSGTYKVWLTAGILVDSKDVRSDLDQGPVHISCILPQQTGEIFAVLC